MKKKEILDANIEYHTKLADSYDQEQGHFRKENIERVEKIIKNLAEKTEGKSFLDIGCGTGFILNIAKKYFNKVVGIDSTPAMLEKVKKSPKIELYQMDLFSAPFKEEFDVCTAYSVLHHLPEINLVFKRVNNFLKKEGYFYADQDPNFYYLEKIKEDSKNYKDFPYSVVKELKSIIEADVELKNKFNLSRKVTRLAEYYKFNNESIFREEKIINLLKKAEFSEINFKYQWFFGQGFLKNEFSRRQLIDIENYLIKILPLSRDLFKYISFIAKK